jgi:hypothetical protein
VRLTTKRSKARSLLSPNCLSVREQIKTTNVYSWRNIRANCGEEEGNLGRGILLWLLGVPIPIIILIALLYH